MDWDLPLRPVRSLRPTANRSEKSRNDACGNQVKVQAQAA